ncbi:MAG: hypothetical protein ACTSR2_10355 [Candidatus Hodarchaeales archaeon]
MNLSFDKISSYYCSRLTVQEFSLKQSFESEGFSFVFQQSFSIGQRSFVIDFFLDFCLFLECSHTSSSQYPLVFRSKAILLESKASFLHRFYPFPMCVLFESIHPFGSKLITTLKHLMPSVSYFFTSRYDLFESLPDILNDLRSSKDFSPTKTALSESNTFEDVSLGQQFNSSSFEPSSFGSHQLINPNRDIPPHNLEDLTSKCHHLQILANSNYSHDLKKESSEGSRVFMNSWEVLI